MDKQLKSKAINIKGKLYVQVADRVKFFNDNYPDGSIHTEILSDDGNGKVVMRASVFPISGSAYFTGISASNPSKAVESQSPYEVAETSAVGRALAFMGIGVIEGIASVDEMAKAGAYNPITTIKSLEATPKQVNYLLTLSKRTGRARTVEEVESMNSLQISQEIEKMRKELGEI